MSPLLCLPAQTPQQLLCTIHGTAFLVVSVTLASAPAYFALLTTLYDAFVVTLEAEDHRPFEGATLHADLQNVFRLLRLAEAFPLIQSCISVGVRGGRRGAALQRRSVMIPSSPAYAVFTSPPRSRRARWCRWR